jgi:hypothetical protein
VGESSNDEAVVVLVLRLEPNTAASDSVAREDSVGFGSDEGIVAVETDHAEGGGISSVPVLDVTVVEVGADGVEVELVEEVGLVISFAQGPGGGLGSAGESQGGTEGSKRRGHVGCWKVDTETENVSKERQMLVVVKTNVVTLAHVDWTSLKTRDSWLIGLKVYLGN